MEKRFKNIIEATIKNSQSTKHFLPKKKASLAEIEADEAAKNSANLEFASLVRKHNHSQARVFENLAKMQIK